MSSENSVSIENQPDRNIIVDFIITILKLVQADIIKLTHYWVILAGYIAMVGIALLGAYLTYHAEQAVGVKSGSGYAFAISLVIRCVDFGAPILYVMICILFAIEVSNSTVKYILTRPVTRLELILSKYVTAMLMVLAALVIFWAVGLITGGYYFGLGDLYESEYLIFEASYIYKQLIIGTLFLLVPFAALAALALMVSSLSSTMGGAIIIGLIFYFFFQILGLIPNTLGITLTWGGEEHLLPYMALGFPSLRFVPMYILDDLPTGIPIDNWWGPDMQNMVFSSAVFFSIFFIISVVAVKKRDFTL